MYLEACNADSHNSHPLERIRDRQDCWGEEDSLSLHMGTSVSVNALNRRVALAHLTVRSSLREVKRNSAP